MGQNNRFGGTSLMDVFGALRDRYNARDKKPFTPLASRLPEYKPQQPSPKDARRGIAEAAQAPKTEQAAPQETPQPVKPEFTRLNNRMSVDNNGKVVVPQQSQQTTIVRGENQPEEYRFKGRGARDQLSWGDTYDQAHANISPEQMDAYKKAGWDNEEAIRSDYAQRQTSGKFGYGLKDGGYGGFASYIGEDGKQRQLYTNPETPGFYDTKEEAKRGQTFATTANEKTFDKADADIFATRQGVAQGWERLNLAGQEVDLKRRALQNESLSPQKTQGPEWSTIKDSMGNEQPVMLNRDGTYSNAMPRGFEKDASDFQRYVQANPKNAQAAYQRLRAKHGSIVDRYFGEYQED